MLFRSQLDEIERDHAAGLIGEREAEAAREKLALAGDSTAAPNRVPPPVEDAISLSEDAPREVRAQAAG